MSQSSFSDNIAPVLDEYLELWTQSKAIKARMDELAPQVRQAAEGLGQCTHGEYSLECVMQPGRKTLDKAKLSAAGIDLSIFEKIGAPFTKLTIKVVE